jgi:biopolymer transport protein ExbB/TolQ
MLELFYSGSKLFMGIQTIVAVTMIVWSAISAKALLVNQVNEGLDRNIGLIKEIGLFAFIIGVLASAIDIIGALDAIEMAGDISPSLLAGGLKITLITPIYGLLIYVLSLLIWFVFNWKANKMIA